jgi:hypothetical protein
MAFERRSQTTARDAKFDVLEIAVIGFDCRSEKIRAFLFSSQNGFAFFESTEDPNARIFAMGYYQKADWPLLQALTAKMQLAHTKRNPWIAAQLREAISEMHDRYPVEVGPASFFAAMNRAGFEELPIDFPELPSTPETQSVASHHVSLVKELPPGITGFFLGSIMTPKAGAQDTVGYGDGGSAGMATGMSTGFQMKVVSSTATGVGAHITSPNLCCDGDETTACVLGLAGPSATDNIILSPVSAFLRRFSSMTLNVLLSVPTNTLSGVDGLVVSYALDGVTYTTVLTVAGGITKPVTLLQASLPVSGNLSQLTVQLNLTAGPGDSGIAGVYLYEVWIVATE